MKDYLKILVLVIVPFSSSCSNEDTANINMNNVYPWCVVAFDSLERSPEERISMLKDFGFTKYAYDWKVDDLDETEKEFKLVKENNLEIISVWFWLNAKRDSIGKLSPRNERVLDILKRSELRTTLWVSFNNNFFKDLTHEQSLSKAKSMIRFIYEKADSIGCKVELYNHGGWFGDLNNQIEIINAMPEYDLKIVYNFHHGHQDIENFPHLVKKIKPYLSSVNLNGMRKDGPKILPIGEGDHEHEMIKLLIEEGFNGPWGILGHVKNEDVKGVLGRNLLRLKSLKLFENSND